MQLLSPSPLYWSAGDVLSQLLWLLWPQPGSLPKPLGCSKLPVGGTEPQSWLVPTPPFVSATTALGGKALRKERQHALSFIPHPYLHMSHDDTYQPGMLIPFLTSVTYPPWL